MKEPTHAVVFEDHTVVPKDGAAIIWSEDDGYLLVLPNKNRAPDSVMVREVCLLAAVATRLANDQEWCDELYEELAGEIEDIDAGKK